MMLKQDKLLNESKRLCWEDRLLHKNSKVRYAANIDLKFLCDSITDPEDHRIRELGYLFKKTVSDSDALVQDKALDALIAYLKAVDANVIGRYANEVCDAVMTKCLTGKPKTVEKAQVVFMLWVELEAVDAFLDAMEKAVTSQVARAVLLAIDFMIQVLSEFGIDIVPLHRIGKMLLEILDHQDQNVLASSKGLTLELCRWVGMNPIKSVLYEKMSDTMKEELDVELRTVKVTVHAPRRLRKNLHKSHIDLCQEALTVHLSTIVYAEINQLQKLSLSDPREQNKLDVDGEDVISVFLFGNVAVRALGTCTGIKIQFFRDVHTFAAVLRCVSIAHFMKARWTVALQKPSEITSQLKNAAWKEPLEELDYGFCDLIMCKLEVEDKGIMVQVSKVGFFLGVLGTRSSFKWTVSVLALGAPKVLSVLGKRKTSYDFLSE
ncbi:MOR1-like protein [Tanacetum coccineum]